MTDRPAPANRLLLHTYHHPDKPDLKIELIVPEGWLEPALIEVLDPLDGGEGEVAFENDESPTPLIASCRHIAYQSTCYCIIPNCSRYWNKHRNRVTDTLMFPPLAPPPHGPLGPRPTPTIDSPSITNPERS